MTFYYPTDDEFNAWFDNASSFDNDWYVVACDVSGYTDFTAEYAGEQRDQIVSNNTLSTNFRRNYYEPTLGLRAIFYIVGVDDHKTTPSWTNGHNRLQSTDYQDEGKNYLEEYEISFPAKHLSNHTSELVALSKDARGYAIPGVSKDDDTDALSVSLADNNAGLQLGTTELSDQTRVIQFRKSGVGANDPWEVADGSTATILVTKKVGGKKYNIARFKLTFQDDQLPLTQTQVSQIGTSNASGKTWNYTYRSPQWMKENLKLLTSQNFDYDPSVAAQYGQDAYFPFPLSWSNSSYAFFDGSKKGDYNGATNINGQYYAEWGNYAIVNNYMGYGDIINDGTQISGTPPKGVGKDDDGYFLFIDASDRPGVLAQLPFDERLCPGSELFMTAWMKSAGIRDNDDAALLFTVLGVKNNADGTVTRTPIYRHSSSQIRATAWLNSRDPGTGPGHNEWYQIYFSFINNDARAADYDSYILQVENNSASTNGGDMYLDDIRVYLMQPTAEVTQLEATCVGARTLMNIKLDWNRLMSRMGHTDSDQGTDAIDFCFIDEAKYNAYLLQNPEQYADAIAASVVEVGNNETGEGGYNGTFNTLSFKLPFTDNAAYDNNKHPNLAADNPNGRGYFYQTTDESGARSLIVDFYSALTPNRPYIMLIQPHISTDQTLDAEDFASDINDACAIKTTFYVTTQTLLRVNGEVVDPSTDFCAGQIFNFSANMRVPTGVNADGTNIYTEIKDGVYFDWFFGSEDEYVAANSTYNGASLMDALVVFRDIYPDNTDLTGVTVGEQTAIDGQKVDFKQEYYDIIKAYMEAAETEGGLHNRLVLHRENLDITLLKSGLQLVIQPIPTVEAPGGSGISNTDWAKVCWSYVPLTLETSGDAPQLHAGFNSTAYPSDDFNPSLRIGLSQIENTTADKPITIDLRGATLVSKEADYIGMITSVSPEVFSKIYLVDTDDPAYKNNTFFPQDFSEYSLPIGTIKSLHAQPYKEGSEYNDKMQVYFDTETTQSNGFQFQPKEGYTYTFAVHFEEQSSDSEESSNACFGSFVVPMKVVPENVVWKGNASGTSNWNKDENWARADKTDLKKDGSDTYPTNEANTTSQGFVPMLFTNVIMPSGSKAELYMAGYGLKDGKYGWDSKRPTYMELPTENIQYDLMAYEKDNALTTQRYRVNICRDIHFEPGAQMLHAEELLYTKAWTDVEVAPGKWTLVSTPLQGVVAGDWYAPTATGQQATEYFKDITFADGIYNRLNPAVYQRSWSDGATIVEQGGTNNTPVSFTTEWSSVYNDASVPYSAGAGFSIKAVSDKNPLLFRFPKADNSYDVSTDPLSRDNAGKLLVSSLINRSKPYVYNPQTDVKVTLKPSPAAENGARYLMVGNPFMTSLDVRKFVEANDSVLAQKYWYVTADGSTEADALENGNWTADTAYQAAPYSAFYVEANNPTAAKVNGIEVKFTADMQVAFTQASGTASASQARALQIEAAGSHGSSQALLSYSAQADNACAGEDAVLLSNLSGNATAAPQVYTVAGNTAVSVNWLKDAQQIPLGVFAATEDDEVTLTFTGLGALRSPRLYDAELNTETLLSEGYQLTVKGSSHGRYFLRSLGGALTGLTPTTTDPELTVYSVRPGELIVSSNATLQSVQVFTADGRRLSPAVQSQSDCVWRLSGVDKGVVLIKATAGNRQQVVRKAMVK